MKCSYCDQKEIENIQERIIREDERDKKWSAFVPGDPEIFGHKELLIEMKEKLKKKRRRGRRRKLKERCL